MTARTYAPREPLALEPRAFGLVMAERATATQRVEEGVGIVPVRGPLMHHDEYGCDSYDAIKARVLAAIDGGARSIVLAIDSPGGLVSGCFATATEIRALCDARGVALYAHADGMAASAAYALAAVASRVYISPAGVIGSIGVIDALVDATAQDRAMGLGYSIIASGARKADGQPHAPTTDAAVAATQARVDALAAVFFDHVAKYRPVTSAQVASYEAGLFVGADAVKRGLADDVQTLDQVVALVRSGADVAAASAQPTTETAEGTMNKDTEEAYRAALQAMIDDEKSDEQAKARAKSILAAMDGEEEKKDDEAKAEGEDPKKDEEEAKAAAAPAPAASASFEARLERMERATLMASRPDLTSAQRAALASVPVSGLEGALAAIPRASAKPAATATVSATRGEGQGSDGRMTLEQANAALGIKAQASGIRREGLASVYPALTPTEAKALLQTKNGGAR